MATLLDAATVMYRIYKRKNTNPAIEWANTYEMQVSGENTLESLTTIGNDIVSAERQLHLESTEYVRMVISTWVPDGQPYNPLSFVTVPLEVVGARSEIGNEAEPLQICLRVAFNAEFGRQGYRLYRNSLLESDVNAISGVPRLVGTGLSTAITAFRTGLGTYLNKTTPPYLVLASTGNIRTVINVDLSGVTVRKFNNRYFDKTST